MFKYIVNGIKNIITRPFLLLLISVLVLAYEYPSRMTIDLFCILLMSILIDSIHFYLVKGRLAIHLIEGLGSIEKGTKFNLQIELRNKAWLPSPYIDLVFHEGERLRLTDNKAYNLLLGAKEVRALHVTYEARLSGSQEVGVKEVSIRDYLGLFYHPILSHTTYEIGVRPQLLNSDLSLKLRGLSRALKAGESIQQKNQEMNCEISSDLEPYSEGEAMKLLHWKLLAQKQIKMVRKRDTKPNQSMPVLLVLSPLHPSELTNEKRLALQDRTLSITLSLIYELITAKQKVNLLYYHEGQWVQENINHMTALQQLREKLSRYEGYIDEHLIRNPLEQVKVKQRVGSKVLISEYIDETLISRIEDFMIETSCFKVVLTGQVSEELGLPEVPYECWNLGGWQEA